MGLSVYGAVKESELDLVPGISISLQLDPVASKDAIVLFNHNQIITENISEVSQLPGNTNWTLIHTPAYLADFSKALGDMKSEMNEKFKMSEEDKKELKMGMETIKKDNETLKKDNETIKRENKGFKRNFRIVNRENKAVKKLLLEPYVLNTISQLLLHIAGKPTRRRQQSTWFKSMNIRKSRFYEPFIKVLMVHKLDTTRFIKEADKIINQRNGLVHYDSLEKLANDLFQCRKFLLRDQALQLDNPYLLKFLEVSQDLLYVTISGCA